MSAENETQEEDQGLRGWGLVEEATLERPVLISPHLDDSVISCGQFLAAHPGTTVVTVFAGVPASYPDPPSRWSVLGGFTAADDGKNDASTTKRFSTSCDRQNGSSTDVRGSVPNTSVPHWCVVLRTPTECANTRGDQQPSRARICRSSSTSIVCARTLFEIGRASCRERVL